MFSPLSSKPEFLYLETITSCGDILVSVSLLEELGVHNILQAL